MIKNLNSFGSTQNQETSKILFTGLDNGGKTSIILALQREYSQIAMLKPTRQAQREIFKYLGRSIAEWDLGGQKRYRIAYLKEPTKYFDNTQACIYVIDIQDRKRLGESLSYLKDVVDKFKELELEDVSIDIFFHKMDPKYVKQHGKDQTLNEIDDLKSKVEAIVEKAFKVHYHKTTIRSLWSIISSFSDILMRIYPQSEYLDKSLEEFAEKLDPCNGILILDNNSLIIGHHYKDSDSKLILKNSLPYFFTLNDSLVNSGSGQDVEMIVRRGEHVFYFDAFKIKSIEEPLYLLIMSPKENFPKEDIKAFKSIVKIV